MKTPKKLFPIKTVDEEWGEEWQGGTFGIFVAHNGIVSKLRVGDTFDVMKRMNRPGAHGDGTFEKGGSGCVVA